MKKLAAQALHELCLEEGADDAGFVEISRPAMAEEREVMQHVFPDVRSLISIVRRLNPENMQAPPRYFANDETHRTIGGLAQIARNIVRRLNQQGVRGLVPPVSFPMDMQRWPGKLWDISHKPVAVAAGMGHMGIHRNVIHPRFGNFILLNTILIDAEVDRYHQALSDNPCLGCHLCVAVCPVGAIHPEEPFDFTACLAHNYREFLGGFQSWVEGVVSSENVSHYRSRFRDPETVSMWQSLAFGPNYKSSYCMAVCPAGEEVIAPWSASREAYVDRVVRPLKEAAEPIYVVPGSPAERAAARHPNKEVRPIHLPTRPQTVRSYLGGLGRIPPKRLQDWAFRIHLSFDGKEALEATLQVQSGQLTVQDGHAGSADGFLRADSETWLRLINGEASLLQSRLRRRIVFRGGRTLLRKLLQLR